MTKWLVPAGIGLAAAVLAWTCLQVGAHLWQDHQDHHLVLLLLQKNIQQGHLAPLEVAPPPKPPEPKK